MKLTKQAHHAYNSTTYTLEITDAELVDVDPSLVKYLNQYTGEERSIFQVLHALTALACAIELDSEEAEQT